LEQFDAALKAKPDFGRAIVGKGTALSLLGQNKEALECLDSLEKATGRPPEQTVLQAKAALMFELGMIKEALEVLERAVALGPSSTAMLLNYGLALSANNLKKEALAQFAKILETEPKHALSLLLKCEMLVSLERPEEALNSLGELGTVAPDDPGILFERGRLLAKLSHFDEAEKVIKRGISLSPQSEDAVQQLLAHIRQKRVLAEKAAMSH